MEALDVIALVTAIVSLFVAVVAYRWSNMHAYKLEIRSDVLQEHLRLVDSPKEALQNWTNGAPGALVHVALTRAYDTTLNETAAALLSSRFEAAWIKWQEGTRLFDSKHFSDTRASFVQEDGKPVRSSLQLEEIINRATIAYEYTRLAEELRAIAWQERVANISFFGRIGSRKS